MNRTSLLAATIALLGTSYWAEPVGAKGIEKFELRARLQANADSPEPDAGGVAKFVERTRADFTRSRFLVAIELPLPSETLPDLAAAEAADLRAVVAADGTTCLLDFEEADEEMEEAEFNVNLSLRTRGDVEKLKVHSGSCDAEGLPAPVAGDTVTVYLGPPADGVVLAEGVFEER